MEGFCTKFNYKVTDFSCNDCYHIDNLGYCEYLEPKPEADRPMQIPAVMRDFAPSEIMEDVIKAYNDIQLRHEKLWIDIFKGIGGHPDTHNLIIPKKLENTLNIIPEKYKDSIFFTSHLDKDMLLTEKVKLDFGPVIPMDTTTQNLA